MRVAFTFTHHSQTPEMRISGETVTVTFREIEPGRTEVTLVNPWTGPAVEPPDYATLGWDLWLDMLEKFTGHDR